MAEEVGEEAADELEASDDKHIDLESVTVVIDRVLYGVIETIVACLCEGKDNEREQILGLEKSVL